MYELRGNILLDFDRCPKEVLLLSQVCGSVSRSDFFFNNNICTLLLVGSRHFLASSVEVMATVEVSHKAVGVRSSSKITESYVARPRPSPHHCFQYTLMALSRPPALLYDIYRSLAKGFPGVHRFSAMTSHKSLIAFQKCDGHIYIYTYIQHLLPVGMCDICNY